MRKKDYDFSGYATKNNLLCSDGRVIKKDAFIECDGKVVPLVWNHGGRVDPDEIIGHALLENKDDGVYAYGYFNNSDKAETVRHCVEHGDITGMSIYANSLKQNGNEVIHGTIRELSLVLIGANPGATIDFVMQHDSDSLDSFYYYLNGDECDFQDHSLSVEHADKEEETEEKEDEEEEEDNDIEKALKSLNDTQKKAVVIFVETMLRQREIDLGNIRHADAEVDEKEAAEAEAEKKEAAKVLDTLTKEQKIAVLVLLESLIKDVKPAENLKHSDEEEDETDKELDEIAEDALADLEDEESDEADEEESDEAEEVPEDTEDEEDPEENEEKETTDMKKNAFEHTGAESSKDYRGVMMAALKDLEKTRSGKLSDAIIRHSEEYGFDDNVLQHAYPVNEFNQTVTYGISDIHYLFPDAKAVPNEPTFIQRNMEWVSKFLNNTKHSPFSRVKSLHFDITAEEARAKGYVKGAEKLDEVMILLKRKTDPCTVYKKQSLDRDDKLDITNFNVVEMMKKELSVMMDEEVARAGLIGDGRSGSSPDKIPELNIRPVYNDDPMYAIRVTVVVPSDATEDEVAKAVIKGCIKGRKQYKGSGRPMFFINPDLISDMLLLEDGIGRSLYATEAELTAKLRVSELVEVPVFENVTRTVNGKNLTLAGIILNPIDYNFGTDRGGEKTLLEGFDIDYNKEKYLLETRCSGALVTPYSAMVVEIDKSGDPIHTVTP